MSLAKPNSIKPLQDKISFLKSIDLNSLTGACYPVPKLSFIEATAEIKEFNRSRLLFSLPNIKLASVSKGTVAYPNRGTVLRLAIPYYINNKDNTKLNRYVNVARGIYTPSVISYIVIDYKIETNIGLASIVRIPSRLMLQEPSGSLYEYDIEDIGGRLTPYVQDAYIVL